MALQLYSKSSEVKLVEALNALDEPADWLAVHFRLDGLLEEYKSDYQIKIAINLINDLLKTQDGGIFVLSDRGIFLLTDAIERTLQNKLIFQLRYLYMDDPLAYTEDGQENPEFCTVYSLGRDMQEVVGVVSRRMAMTARKTTGGRPTAAAPARQSAAMQPKAAAPAGVVDLSGAGLAVVEHDLRRVDLTKSIRRQPVCAVLPNGEVRRVFDELYIHIAHLRQMLKSEVDFLSNRWLFKYLTQILDTRMLTMMGLDSAQYLASPISINMNAETLLSSSFATFDAAVPPEAKVSVVIEVPVVDVFADINGFMIAKNEVQKLGYRVCLDGVTAQSLLHLDREKLGVDLVKVQWNAAAESDLETSENRELAAAIQRCGTKRVILCRCDSKQAIEFGQALGVSLYQGRYIDTLVNPSSTVEN